MNSRFKSQNSLLHVVTIVAFLIMIAIFAASRFYIFDACEQKAFEIIPPSQRNKSIPLTEEEVKLYSNVDRNSGNWPPLKTAYWREVEKCKSEPHSIFYFLKH